MSSTPDIGKITAKLAFMIACAISLSGCWIQHDVEIKPDAKVDPRLEGVWQIMHTEKEGGQEDDGSNDLGVQGYIIFSKVDESTYKCIAIDHIEKDSESKLPDMLVSTKDYKKHHFLNARVTEYELEKQEAEEGKKTPVKRLLLDYEFNKAGELILMYLDAGDFEDAAKVHPIKSSMEDDKSDSTKGPVAFSILDLKGDEGEILNFYSDPKVRSLFTSFGKYQKLRPAKGK